MKLFSDQFKDFESPEDKRDTFRTIEEIKKLKNEESLIAKKVKKFVKAT